MTKEQMEKIRSALEQSWSKSTSYLYGIDGAPPSYGQCAQTAIVIWETFGGQILKTDNVPMRSGRHFYNRINGVRCDFTADQFDIPEYSHRLVYKDILSSAEDAATEASQAQVNALRQAFNQAWAEANAG